MSSPWTLQRELKGVPCWFLVFRVYENPTKGIERKLDFPISHSHLLENPTKGIERPGTLDKYLAKQRREPYKGNWKISLALSKSFFSMAWTLQRELKGISIVCIVNGYSNEGTLQRELKVLCFINSSRVICSVRTLQRELKVSNIAFED